MYEALLGPDWEDLPEVVRPIHAPGEFRGRFDITRGRSPLARVAAWICGFPASGESVAVALAITAEADRWVWRRRFGDVVVTTWQQGYLREGFGPTLLDFELVTRETTWSGGFPSASTCATLGRLRAMNGEITGPGYEMIAAWDAEVSR